MTNYASIKVDVRPALHTLTVSCPVTFWSSSGSVALPLLAVPSLYLEKNCFSYLKRQKADFEEFVAENER